MTKAREAFGQYIELCQSTASKRQTTELLAELNAAGNEVLTSTLGSYRRDPMGVDGTHIDQLVAPDYGVNLMHVDMPVDAAASFKCGVPNLNSLLVVVANDIFHPTEQLLRNKPDGLTVCSLRSVPAELKERVATTMARSLKNGEASALNAMLLGDGVLIHVAKDVKVEKAIQIVNISNPTIPLLSPRRVVIIAEEAAEIRVLLCDHSQTGTVEHLSLECVDIDVAENAHIELYDIEEGTATSRRLWLLNALQASHSHLTVNTTYLHGGKTRNDFRIAVEGDYADTSLSGLAICADEQVVDNQVTLTHSGCHCTSRQLFKNALFDNSRGGFGGKIIVANGAMFTDASQTNRNILAGDNARMTAAPQLEIYCDEVQCSHGATTGQLDERALFYMQARGIPEDEARRMLTQAFMVDVIDNISFEVLRQRIHVLVEKRLSGAAASCDTCATSCHPEITE